MQIKHFIQSLLLLIPLIIFSCGTPDNEISRDLTVAEVQQLYQQLQSATTNGRQTDDLSILWDSARHMEVTTGGALVFPLQTPTKKYVRLQGESLAYPLNSHAQAFAYRLEDGTLQLDYVQRIPTAWTEGFTGYVSVSDWNGALKHLFRYENGQYITDPNNGRTEETTCFWIDTEYCTTLTGGDGLVYEGNCYTESVLHCHVIDVPPAIAPEDFGDTGGGGDGDGSIAMCPHPFMIGEFIPCEEEQNPCEVSLSIKYPAEALKIRNNGLMAITKTLELFPPVKLGDGYNDCADAFRHAYFNMLNTKAVGPILTREFGVAHECSSTSEVETKMDKYNNEMGIIVALDYPGLTDAELIEILLQKLYSGKLRILSNLKEGNEVTDRSQVITSATCDN